MQAEEAAAHATVPRHGPLAVVGRLQDYLLRGPGLQHFSPVIMAMLYYKVCLQGGLHRCKDGGQRTLRSCRSGVQGGMQGCMDLGAVGARAGSRNA